MKSCAIYTRVSTAMQAEVEYNSCEAQKDRIMSYIKSQEDLEFFKEYSDPGYSGGDLERPALKALLKDIEDKKVDEVLTYKIDRLTRSSKDFYTLIEFFEKHGVSYVSVTERFDTSSPSGRLLRNIMLTFAQFEREMGSERTKDKLMQRAEKGMKNGGCVPLGYKGVDKKLVVDKPKAKIIQEIFEEFVETGSLVKAWRVTIKHDLRGPRSGRPFSLSGVWAILRHPVYIGKLRWNKRLFPGQHEPIISEELFEEAQKLKKEKIIKKRLHKKYLLSPMVKCAECGSTMTNTYTNKKKRRYYYYKCVKVMKEGSGVCSTKEINAEKLEVFLIQNLSRIAEDKQYLESLAFKISHETPRQSRIELPGEYAKNLVNRMEQVLINFKNKIHKGSQIEKCLLLQKTIKGIKFSKRSLEVVINLKDTNTLEVGGLVSNSLGCTGARIRAGASNSLTPACSSGSKLQNGTEGGSRTHNLVRGSVFETDAYANSATSATNGGPERSRTADLLNAIEALYQLSYRPESLIYLHLLELQS